jgi:hypothetical protein
MRRREFIAGLASATAWPLAARAQQGDRVRLIGVLVPFDENDPLAKTLVSAFIQALAGFGWTDGRNVRMEIRWGGGDNNRIRALAQELVGLQPDIILATGTPATIALQRETSTIPIVFASVVDPVASGIVARLLRRQCCGGAEGYDNRYAAADEIGCEHRQPIVLILRPDVFNCNVLAHNVACLFQTLGERCTQTRL